MQKWNTKKLARAAVIAALYAVVTWALGEAAFGPLQIRPAEALCVLPLFFVEAVPGLYVGCMLANLMSGFGPWDIFLGSLATLFGALCTYGIGRVVKSDWLKLLLGGIFPVLFNAFLIPAVMILGGLPDLVYWEQFAGMLITEGVWIYVLGTLLYFAIKKLRAKNVRVLQS